MNQQTGETVLQPAIVEPHHPGVSRAMTILIVLTLLVITMGGGLISYATVIHPMQLHAQATAIVRDLQTTSSPQYMYDQVTSRAPTVNDAFDSQRALWQNDTICTFTSGVYHLQLTTATTNYYCLKEDRNYRNFVYQVKMTVEHGIGGGIVFRAESNYNAYGFGINNNGIYSVAVASGSNHGKVLAYGRSMAIKQGLNQENLLAVMARGSTIDFYINKQFVTSVSDDTYATGEFGCAVGNPTQTNVDVIYSNAQIWNL